MKLSSATTLNPNKTNNCPNRPLYQQSFSPLLDFSRRQWTGLKSQASHEYKLWQPRPMPQQCQSSRLEWFSQSRSHTTVAVFGQKSLPLFLPRALSRLLQSCCPREVVCEKLLWHCQVRERVSSRLRTDEAKGEGPQRRRARCDVKSCGKCVNYNIYQVLILRLWY
jgi:hypothetical protein